MSTLTETEKKILFPERTVRIGERDFSVRPFSFRQTVTVLDKFRPVISSLVMAESQGELTGDRIIELLLVSGESIIDVISMVIGEDKDFVADLDNQSIVDLLMGIYEANKSFFEKLGVQATIAR